MIRRTKILLGFTILFLVAGLVVNIVIKPPNAPALYVLLPVGAIFLGLFLTSRMLEKESVFHDEERHAAEDNAAAHGHSAKK